jgi:hypothetical protein
VPASVIRVLAPEDTADQRRQACGRPAPKSEERRLLRQQIVIAAHVDGFPEDPPGQAPRPGDGVITATVPDAEKPREQLMGENETRPAGLTHPAQGG